MGVTSLQLQGLKVNLGIHVLGFAIPSQCPQAVALLQNPVSCFKTTPPLLVPYGISGTVWNPVLSQQLH